MQVRPDDDRALVAALEQARIALAEGDVPIGAVVMAPDGLIVGVGRNRRELDGDPTAHAEVVAIRAAAASVGEWRLRGMTLAVTLEPCPMCAGAAWLSRVDRIIFGAWNPEYGAAGSLWDVLRDGRLNHRPEVVGGVREQECSQLLTGFFSDRR